MAAQNPLDLLGPSLLSKSGEVPRAEALAGKTAVALYFSAHWCPPCKAFTPKLAATFERLKDRLAIVFVSSDKTPEEFAGYFASMPWLALPYANRSARQALSSLFKVSGIPSLIVLGADGAVINDDARGAVMNDPAGDRFPWAPPSIPETIGETLVTSGGDVRPRDEALAGKYVALYFSASWCGPCKQFTPLLKQAYEAINANGQRLEVVFVSADRDDASFAKYYATMPWLAVPFGDEAIDALNERFKIQGIPSLVLLDVGAQRVLLDDATSSIREDPTAAGFPWPRKLIEVLGGSYTGDLNEKPSVVLFCEELSADARAAVAAAAEPCARSNPDMAFFITHGASRLSQHLRGLTMLLETSVVSLVLFDIPDNGGFYVSPAAEVDADAVASFVEAYKARALERRQLERG
eukprot:a174521_437.p1 GENE.a174521_437~~a174521_437.p1  ORF type:complete len:423 (+),score=165.01 a174521_437:45-1271(+)